MAKVSKAKDKVTNNGGNRATVDMDKDQSDEGSYMHAMKNQYQTRAEAKKAADDFVRRKFKYAKSLLKRGERNGDPEDIKEAYYQFGLGLHTLQDATSPAHARFQLWTGDKETAQQILDHIKQEMLYPGTSSNLQWVTNIFLQWFESSSEVIPETNIFDLISPDHVF